MTWEVVPAGAAPTVKFTAELVPAAPGSATTGAASFGNGAADASVDVTLKTAAGCPTFGPGTVMFRLYAPTTGVTANIVGPGSTRGVRLEASAAVYDLPSQDTFAGQALLRRLLEPDEVAAAIAWLCSRDAGALTGAVIPVDAGLSA